MTLRSLSCLPVRNLAVVMAPELVGLLQINIQLPAGLLSGQDEARATIGANTVQTGVPVFVQWHGHSLEKT